MLLLIAVASAVAVAAAGKPVNLKKGQFVAPKDIAFIRPGQAANVKFTAYDFSIYGGLDATCPVAEDFTSTQGGWDDPLVDAAGLDDGELPALFAAHPVYAREEKVRIDVLNRFGYYSTESNGHLSEYLPWYRKRTNEIEKWIDLSSWINGETGGYLRVCTEGRNWFEHDFPNWMKEPPREFTPEKRGMEHGTYIIEGLETGRPYRSIAYLLEECSRSTDLA